MGNKGILTMRDIKDILRAWANVRISRRIGTEYPYKSSAFKGAKIENNYRAILNEDECDQVDDAMKLLFRANVQWYELISSYYLSGMSCNKLSRILGTSNQFMKSEIEKAEIYIFAKLDDKIQDLAA